MCNNAVDAACRTDAPSLAAKAVMLVLAHHKNFRSGVCSVSGATLAKEAQQDIRTVRRSVAALEEAGLIRVLPKARRTGIREEVNRYALTFANGHNVRAMQEADALADEARIAEMYAEEAGESSDEQSAGVATRHSRGGAGAVASGASPQEPPLTTREKEDSAADAASSTPKVDIGALVEVLWHAASDKGRERSSKADLTAAVEAAVKRGHGADVIIAGMRGYFASDDATKDDGAFQKGVHRMIARDRFLTFVPAPQPAARSAGRTADGIGTMEAPGVDLQRAWMARFLEGQTWNADRGPEPGREGCRISAEIQREFGVDPFDRPAGGPAPRVVAVGDHIETATADGHPVFTSHDLEPIGVIADGARVVAFGINDWGQINSVHHAIITAAKASGTITRADFEKISGFVPLEVGDVLIGDQRIEIVDADPDDLEADALAAQEEFERGEIEQFHVWRDDEGQGRVYRVDRVFWPPGDDDRAPLVSGEDDGEEDAGAFD